MNPERIVLLVLAVMLVASCGRPGDDETRLRERLASMEAALEEGRVGDFMDAVAEDFTSARGELDQRTLGMLIRRERLARQSISIQRSNLALEMHEAGRASLRFHALAAGGSGWLPSEGRLWAIDTGWRLDEDEWMLVSADWRPLAGTP